MERNPGSHISAAPLQTVVPGEQLLGPLQAPPLDSEPVVTTKSTGFLPTDSIATHDGDSEGHRDVAIVLMGLTGAGKSTFISLLTEESVEIGHSLQACTTKAMAYTFRYNEQTMVHLIDTPGFDDTSRSNIDILKEIAVCLNTLSINRIALSGLLYLHRITDPKMSGSAVKSLQIFQKICGVGAYPHVTLTTTMWEALAQRTNGEQVGQERVKSLSEKEEFWGSMVRGGSRVRQHLGCRESAIRIVEEVLSSNLGSALLDLQLEMMDEGRSLEETTAGQFLQKDLNELRKRYEEEIADLEHSLAEAKEEQDQELIELLMQERQDRESMLAKNDMDKKTLSMGFKLQPVEEDKIKQPSALLGNSKKYIDNEHIHRMLHDKERILGERNKETNILQRKYRIDRMQMEWARREALEEHQERLRREERCRWKRTSPWDGVSHVGAGSFSPFASRDAREDARNRRGSSTQHPQSRHEGGYGNVHDYY